MMSEVSMHFHLKNLNVQLYVILNKINVKNEEEKVNEFIKNIHSKLVGILDRDEIVVVAEEDKKTVLEAFP